MGYFYAHLKACILQRYKAVNSHWMLIFTMCTVFGETGGDSLSYFTQKLIRKCQRPEVME